MATIDQLDIRVFVEYAKFTNSVETTVQEYRLEQAGFVPPQTIVPDFRPKPSEMEMLLGIIPFYHPWAKFFAYKKFLKHRRPAFSKHSTASSLGSLEKQEADFNKLSSIKTSNSEEESEKNDLCECFEEIEKINGWMGYILGRLGQYLQG